MSRKKVKGTASSMPMGIMRGSLVSVISTCLFAGLLAWLMLNEVITQEILGYCIMTVLLFSSMIGSLVSALAIKRRWMLICWFTGNIYYLSLLGITALFFGSNFTGVGVSAIVINLGSIIAGTITLTHKRHYENRYEKYRSS